MRTFHGKSENLMIVNPAKSTLNQDATFRWADFDEWSQTMRQLLGRMLDEHVIEKFNENPPEYVVSDNLGWLDALIRRAHPDIEKSVHEELAALLAMHYEYIVGFHGCRPTSLGSYRRYGLTAPTRARLSRSARRVFGASETVENAIDQLRAHHGFSYDEGSIGVVYFTLCREHLEQDCGHYLLYGSEYLTGIGARVGQQRRLREIGKATVIECRIPISDFPTEYLRYLAGEMVEEFFERQRDSEWRGRSGFGFPVAAKIHPTNILAFHHPTNIPDPLNHRMLGD